MKKLVILLLTVIMISVITACDERGETPSNDNGALQTESKGTVEETAAPEDDDDSNDNAENDTAEKCLFCYDMSGYDRKCDECGSWVYEKGEAWTKEVPENLKVTIFDYHYNYHVIEKIGDELYIKEYLSEDAYNNNGDFVESYVTMTSEHHRDYSNGQYTDWRDNGFPIKYGDEYEMFAVKVLQNLTGTSLSNSVESCLEAASSGTETVAGMECVIKEYDGNFGMKYKLWMWNNIPLKSAQMDTNTETEWKIMYEILEWDTAITEFSENMPE